eukprot:8160810-Lingulodinium_polyedra.AAC.1
MWHGIARDGVWALEAIESKGNGAYREHMRDVSRAQRERIKSTWGAYDRGVCIRRINVSTNCIMRGLPLTADF